MELEKNLIAKRMKKRCRKYVGFRDMSLQADTAIPVWGGHFWGRKTFYKNLLINSVF